VRGRGEDYAKCPVGHNGESERGGTGGKETRREGDKEGGKEGGRHLGFPEEES
jgi:hypothetical protein